MVVLLGVAGEVIEDQGDVSVQDEAALGHRADADVNPVGMVAALADAPLEPADAAGRAADLTSERTLDSRPTSASS